MQYNEDNITHVKMSDKLFLPEDSMESIWQELH
jgi:hypothetical protein